MSRPLAIGDKIGVEFSGDTTERTVVGFLSNGLIIYEFLTPSGWVRCNTVRPEHSYRIAPKVKKWINIYTDDLDKGTVVGALYDSKEEALAASSGNVYLTDTIEIEYEDNR